MTFDELAEYNKDFKNLSKKYSTLQTDLDVVKKILEALPDNYQSLVCGISN
jgi:hypothetical protein